MLSIEMLQAERGDALLIEYGEGSAATNRVLIDGGPVNSGNYDGVRNRLLQIEPGPDGRRHFDLLVISHIDSDHLEGIISLLQDDMLRCVFDDVWYNDWKHIAPLQPGATAATLGAVQGEFLGALLAHQGRPWNQYFRGAAVFVPDDGPLPVVVLRGGLSLTLLSPTIEKLAVLATKWEAELKNIGFKPGDAAAALAQLSGKWWARPPVTLGSDDRIATSDDRSAANGSSIAFLASWKGRTLLLGADAHDDVLTASLRRVRAASAAPDQPVAVDGFKLSHHGSQHNTTPRLMAELTADVYLVSSNGAKFKHPNALAIRTVLDAHRGVELPVVCFNYRQPQTTIWETNPRIVARYGPDAVLGFDG